MQGKKKTRDVQFRDQDQDPVKEKEGIAHLPHRTQDIEEKEKTVENEGGGVHLDLDPVQGLEIVNIVIEILDLVPLVTLDIKVDATIQDLNQKRGKGHYPSNLVKYTRAES